MEGVTFYFFMWFWIIVAIFLMDTKWKHRKLVIIFLCCLLISSAFTISFFDITIRSTYFILLIGCLYLFTQIRGIKKKYLLIYSFSIGLFYSAFQMLKIYDPVYFFYSPLLMTTCLMVVVGSLGGRGYIAQLFSVILGILAGELLLALVLHRYGLYNEIVSLFVLDCLALIWTLLSVLHLFVFCIRFVKKRGMRKEKIS